MTIKWKSPSKNMEIERRADIYNSLTDFIGLVTNRETRGLNPFLKKNLIAKGIQSFS